MSCKTKRGGARAINGRWGARIRALTALALALPPAACGDLPQPFKGAPGAEAQRLAHPPPARLAVLTPSNALLTEAASKEFASDLAHSLQAAEAPATDGPLRPGDWRLVTTADQQAGTVTPTYTLQNPKGAAEASAAGKPVPASNWAAADPGTLQQAAEQAAPEVVQLLMQIRAARMKSDPNSLYNRPARLFVPDVTGAPGDGNQALTKQMRDKLGKQGFVVQTSDKDADFTVRGQVRAVPIAGGMLRVEIQWFLLDPTGDQRGDVIQLNEVPPATVTHYWGDVAVAVAEEAAGGMKDAILTQAGLR